MRADIKFLIVETDIKAYLMASDNSKGVTKHYCSSCVRLLSKNNPQLSFQCVSEISHSGICGRCGSVTPEKICHMFDITMETLKESISNRTPIFRKADIHMYFPVIAYKQPKLKGKH